MASASRLPVPNPEGDGQPSEFDRLERAVRALIEERATLRVQNESMCGELEAMQGLQERLLAESQLRQDALKRIDALVDLLGQLDPSLATAKRAK